MPFLFAGITNEGDPLNKPPRISILAEIIVLQSLSILLQQEAAIDIDGLLWGGMASWRKLSRECYIMLV